MQRTSPLQTAEMRCEAGGSACTLTAPPRPRAVDLRILPLTPEWKGHERAFRARKLLTGVDVIDLQDHTVYPSTVAVASDGKIARHTIRKPALLQGIPSLREASVEWRREVLRRGFVDTPPAAETQVVEEPCILLGSGQPSTYYHWLIEFVTKLDLIRQVQGPRRLVVPRLVHPYHSESLRYFGVEPEDCIVLNKATRFRDLRTTSGIAVGNQRLSSFIGEFFKRRSGRGGRKLYVSRKDAKRRFVLNEADVMRVLSRAGFEEVCPGSLSFAEQVELFGGASVVVGPHGAGLANTGFMPKGSKVIELLPDSFHGGIACYAALSEECSFQHVILLCQSVGSGGHANLVVPLDPLGEALCPA